VRHLTHAGTGFALRLAGVENNHRPRYMRASVELAHGDAAQPIRPLSPENHHTGDHHNPEFQMS